jgi:hypothetical protein
MSEDNPTGGTPEEIIAQYKSAKRKKRSKIIVGVIVAFIVLSAIGSTQEDSQKSVINSSASSSSAADSSWVPSGFTQWVSDDNLAWRWATSAETTCTYGTGACWAAMVVSKDGCPRSLYAEVNIFDKNDVQISYTNDTLSSVQPLQKVRLTFDTFSDEAQTAQISKFSCY